jgi:hypothetical protein
MHDLLEGSKHHCFFILRHEAPKKIFSEAIQIRIFFLKNLGGLSPEAPLKYATAKHAWRNQYVSADLSILFVFY